MPIVRQDGPMLGNPQSKFPWCAKMAHGRGVRGQVSVGRQPAEARIRRPPSRQARGQVVRDATGQMSSFRWWPSGQRCARGDPSVEAAW